jgi:hypothetical protein
MLKWVTFVAPLLIFLGIHRLYFYYHWFGINIISFLDFSEIITSILDFIVAFLFLNVPLILLLASIFIKRSKVVAFIFVLAGIVIQVLNLVNARILIDNYMLSPMNIVSVAFILVVLYFKYMGHRRPQVIMDIMYPFIVLALLMFWVLSGAVATEKAQRVIVRKSFSGVKIVLKDSIVMRTDSSNYYIGNTTNYVFVYHEKNKQTEVKKMSDVQTIIFPNESNSASIERWRSDYGQ